MSKRVMVVDDSRLVRVQLEDVLTGTDYEVAAHCRSGEEAIERYAGDHPEKEPGRPNCDDLLPGL